MIALQASPFKHVTVMTRVAMTHILHPSIFNDCVIPYHDIGHMDERFHDG